MSDEHKRKRRPKGVGTVKPRKQKRGDARAWLFRVTVDGKVFATTDYAKTKTEALDKLSTWVAKVRSGEVDEQKREAQKLAAQPTLAEWAPVFLSQHVTQDLDRAATRTAYGNMLRLYIVPALGSHRLSDITTPMVREMFQELYRRGKAMGTVKLAFAVLHRCFDAAVDDKHLKESPVPKFSKLRLAETAGAGENAKRRALTGPQVAALLGACADKKLLLWVSIMASAGLRPGEASGLHWNDIDLKAGELHVRGAVKKVYGPAPGDGSRVWIGKTKTPSSRRTVAMGPTLAGLLAAERARQEAGQREMRGLPANVTTTRPMIPDDACVFFADPATAEGLRTPQSPNRLSRQFKRAIVRAGLPKNVSPHWLRHTAISHAIAEGAPLADASRRAGHKNPAITAAIYTHAVGEGERKAAMIGDSLLTASDSAGVEQIAAHKGQE